MSVSCSNRRDAMNLWFQPKGTAQILCVLVGRIVIQGFDRDNRAMNLVVDDVLVQQRMLSLFCWRRHATLIERCSDDEIEREVQRRLAQQPRRQNDAHSSIDMDLADDPDL